MTTTLRPLTERTTESDGRLRQEFAIRANGRQVGSVTLRGPDGRGAGELRDLRVLPERRRRGYGAIAILAAEEILRSWGATHAETPVPADPEYAAGQRLLTSMAWRWVAQHLRRPLPAQPAPLPPEVRVRPMTDAEFDGWRSAAVAEFGRCRAEIDGVSLSEGVRRAEESYQRLLPDGPRSPGAVLRVLVTAEDTVAGVLWLGDRPPGGGPETAYVYEVEVVPELRGRGYGRALMLAAEAEALALGARALELNVCADNLVAQRLYESLGYRVVDRWYAKTL